MTRLNRFTETIRTALKRIDQPHKRSPAELHILEQVGKGSMRARHVCKKTGF